MVLRDRDTNADGAFDERRYYFQNWRYDVVMLVTDGGVPVERVRYNAYGRPECYSPADVATIGGAPVPDGSLTADDSTAFFAAWGIATSTFQCDFVTLGGSPVPDGSVTVDDYIAYYSSDFFYSGHVGGIGKISDSGIDNRKGYAGYEFDPVLAGAGGTTSAAKYHVRNRVLDCNTGRWMSEDKLGYVEGMSLYQYVGDPTCIDDLVWRLVECCQAAYGKNWPSHTLPACLLAKESQWFASNRKCQVWRPKTNGSLQYCLNQCRSQLTKCDKAAQATYDQHIKDHKFDGIYDPPAETYEIWQKELQESKQRCQNTFDRCAWACEIWGPNGVRR